MNTIEVIDLKKSYKSDGKVFEAVKGVSFNIKKGEIFGLLGPNGAGKSSTINMISGILLKDSGKITILGKDPQKEPEYVKTRMNVSSAYASLTKILTVNQNLLVYAKIYGVKNPKKKIEELLQKFELIELKDKKTEELSSGERTRLNLCKGFLNDPEILLLDECTVGLDPDVAEKTRKIIKKYQKEKGATILFTSHYMNEVEELCDRVAFMSKGEIIRIDTTKNLKELITKDEITIYLEKIKEDINDFFKEKNIEVNIKDNTVSFEINPKSTNIYSILNELSKKGYTILDMHIKKPTLDDVFIKIARGKI